MEILRDVEEGDREAKSERKLSSKLQPNSVVTALLAVLPRASRRDAATDCPLLCSELKRTNIGAVTAGGIRYGTLVDSARKAALICG